jgi:hypothetical protein
MPTDQELINAFYDGYVIQAGKGNADKVFSVVFDNGEVKYMRAPNISTANKFSREYGMRFANGARPLFVTLDHQGKFVKK